MKIDYHKEWFERSAEIEGTAEVGAGIQPKAHMVIADLLESMDNVKDRTDEELLGAFLDTEAEPVIRDTAQVILEARKLLKSEPPEKRFAKAMMAAGLSLAQMGKVAEHYNNPKP